MYTSLDVVVKDQIIKAQDHTGVFLLSFIVYKDILLEDVDDLVWRWFIQVSFMFRVFLE